MSDNKPNVPKAELESLNITEENLNALQQLLPTVFEEGKVNFDKLKAVLGENVANDNERFGLQWAGKNKCWQTIQERSRATLKPDREESVNFDETENIFIEGDNLEVLKLLQKGYYGKVKMIYIDPPYNTGKEFVYPDNYNESLETYLEYTGQVDENGKSFSTNKDTEGRFHSKWLNMMYPRLYLARNLLKDDGVIFISIDNNEQSNLKKICDEIFGEENFIQIIVWKKKTGSGSKIEKVFSEHEYILIYVKNNSDSKLWRVFNENDGNFKNPDNDKNGAWESCAITAPSKNRNKNQLYQIEVYFNSTTKKTNFDGDIIDEFFYHDHLIVLRKSNATTLKYDFFDEKDNYALFIRRWAYIPTTMRTVFEKNRVYLNGKNLPRYKKYETEYDGKALRSVYFNEFSTQQGSDELTNIFGQSLVEYPKPKELIKLLVEGVTYEDKHSVILDFFSGSCSTAHAVLDLNKEDNGNRKFIMVQLPEPTGERNEAHKAGYKTIADIGKERIRRVIKQIEDEQKGELDFEGKKQDLGFKVFKLDQSNFKVWDGNPDQDIGKNLELFVDHIDPNASQEDILYELLLKAGFPLTTQITTETMEDKTVFSIADGLMFICLEDELTNELMRTMAKRKPLRVICLDSGFKENDQLLSNAVQIMKSEGVEDFRTV